MFPKKPKWRYSKRQPLGSHYCQRFSVFVRGTVQRLGSGDKTCQTMFSQKCQVLQWRQWLLRGFIMPSKKKFLVLWLQIFVRTDEYPLPWPLVLERWSLRGFTVLRTRVQQKVLCCLGRKNNNERKFVLRIIGAREDIILYMLYDRIKKLTNNPRNTKTENGRNTNMLTYCYRSMYNSLLYYYIRIFLNSL